MHRRLPQSQIRPQISTMPRQQTEAAAYLDIYKLVNEKTRLEHELESLEQRRDRITQRLEILGEQVTQLEVTAHQLRDDLPLPAKLSRTSQSVQAPSLFKTEFLEY